MEKYRIVEIGKNDAFCRDSHLIGKELVIIEREREIYSGWFSGKVKLDDPERIVIRCFLQVKLERVE